MNQFIPPTAPAGRGRAVRLGLLTFILLLASLVVIVGAPAWAASGPVDIKQGTVPSPPGGGDDDDDEGSPVSPATATPTPAAPTGEEPPAPAGTPLPPGSALPPAGSAAAPAGSTVAPANATGVVTALRLNVRNGPGVVYTALGQVTQNTVLTIQYRNPAGDWWYSCCISGTKTSGWVSAAFVRPDFNAAQANTLIPIAPGLPGAQIAAAAPRVALTGTQGLVDVFRLNLRSQPSTNGVILGKLLQGEVVEILARNSEADWWYVCCLNGTRTEGWVSAQFLTPAFSRSAAPQLLPVQGEVHAILPTPTPKPGATPVVSMASNKTPAASALLTPSTPATTTLGMRLWQEPEFAAAGEDVWLRFAISNTGAITASQVEVRNELLPTLLLGAGQAGSGGLFKAGKAGNGNVVFTITWPELAPGGELTATVGITLAETLTDGTVVDTIAAVGAANAAATTTGILIGLPPVGLPDFQ